MVALDVVGVSREERGAYPIACLACVRRTQAPGRV